MARQAGALPNPTLGVEVENFSGSGPYRGLDFAETTATIGLFLSLIVILVTRSSMPAGGVPEWAWRIPCLLWTVLLRVSL